MHSKPSPEDPYKAIFPMKAAILLSVLVIILQVTRVFVPTTRELAVIKVVPMIANNEDMQGLGRDAMELAREWVKELKPKVEKEAKK